MGLDQYLRAERYVSAYDFRPESEQQTYRKILSAVALEPAADPDTPTATVSIVVAYWRKANQIHRWFVVNAQGGEDDCRPHHVTREQLVELRGLCQRVLQASHVAEGIVKAGETYKAEWGEWRTNLQEGKIVLNPEVAAELLPTQGGFFFGSTDYDEWYLHDLVSTVEQLDRVLEHTPDDVDFYYESSW